MSKKILKRVSKKVMAFLLTISMLFSNFMPLATVFALTNDEKADLVEMRMRGANNITIENGEATINYVGGYAIVSGADLQSERNDNWDYGDHTGVMYVLYSSSTSLTFYFHPEDGRYVTYRIGGNNQERPENNQVTFNDLETFSVLPQGYDFEFEFFTDDGNQGGNEIPMPNGTIYSVDFGTASWEVNGTIVTASVQVDGIDLTDGFQELEDGERIHLANFDPDTMEVRVTAGGGFSSELYVDDYNLDYTTCLAWTLNGVLPMNEDLYFVVQPKANNQEGVYLVEFGDAEWNIDGEYVSASLENNNMVLTEGPVEIDAHQAIHLEGFNHETMVVVIEDHHNGFRTELFVDESGNTSIDAAPPESHVPNENVLFFFIDRVGNNEPSNPYQEGNSTAIIRVNGVEGTYTEMSYDDNLGYEVEVERPYDGKGAISNELKFNVNRGNIWSLLPNGETEDDHGWFLYNEIEYPYDEEEGDTTVELGLFTEWHRKLSNVISINNVNYNVSDYLDYENSSEWLTHQNDGRVGFYITVPKAEDNVYNITVQIDPNDIEYVSEFRWTNDPERMYVYGPDDQILYDENDEPLINPEFFEHLKIEIVNVNFSVGNQSYNYNENDFSSHSFSDTFIDYAKDNNGNYLGGHLLVPSGTEVTMRITPEPGYQLDDVSLPGDFIPQDEPCEYTFILPNHTEELELIAGINDDIQMSANDDIEEVGIELAAATVINGNYEFYANNVDLTNEEIEAFETYADNYAIQKYFNLSLEQVFYNTILEDGVYDYSEWYIPLNNLNKKATVTLSLFDAISADKIVIIHSLGGNEFEIIEPTVNNKLITFETKRFGDFAIATMNLTEIEGIDITLTPPTPGVKVDVTMQHDDETGEDYPVSNPVPEAVADNSAPFVIDGTAWVNGTCYGGNNACNERFNGTFDVRGDYYAMINVSAKEGYRFTLDTLDNITVNGRDLDTGNGDEIFNIYNNGAATMFLVRISPEGLSIVKGDMSGNGRVDLADIIILLRKYLNDDATSDDIQMGDMDNDGKIGLKDVILLLREYLNS